MKPEEWASRLRMGRWMKCQAKGELHPGEYLPEMTEEERRYADELAETFAAFVRDHAAQQKGEEDVP
jgi:hypothetical protein